MRERRHLPGSTEGLRLLRLQLFSEFFYRCFHRDLFQALTCSFQTVTVTEAQIWKLKNLVIRGLQMIFFTSALQDLIRTGGLGHIIDPETWQIRLRVPDQRHKDVWVFISHAVALRVTSGVPTGTRAMKSDQRYVMLR